jgi:TnpA family transposase
MEVGRVNKTLYLLNYIDDEDYRRRILTQLNRGECRHAVARAICYERMKKCGAVMIKRQSEAIE